MASLISRLTLGNGAHQSAEDSMYIVDGSLFNTHAVDLHQTVVVSSQAGNDYDAYRLAVAAQASMDVTEATDGSVVASAIPATQVAVAEAVVEDDQKLGLHYRYDPDNYGRLNTDLGSNIDTDSMTLQWPSLSGHVEESGYNRTLVSSNITMFIDQDGENGGLDPGDPTDPPDPPVDPGEDPDVVVVGGISEIDVTVNPNSFYTIRLAVSQGAEIMGVLGMDTSMSWNGRTKTLTGWMLGTGPKEVTVDMGEDSAKLVLRAEPVARHII